ncbi:MAG: hypothetical protein QG592_1033, partial [Pseudomonadota bacterium]|nr:hypothetical protein [Pseudomonadota bacterium]
MIELRSRNPLQATRQKYLDTLIGIPDAWMHQSKMAP